ncbi:MAG: tetratricopeptide repeat protein [Deltaproteobacteria bacterium]|nr:tetratricopeptide repeat protein [Deltaproteobacteria bacterium]
MKLLKLLMISAIAMTMPCQAAVAAADPDVQALRERLTNLEEAWRQQGVEVAQKMTAVDAIRADWNGFQGTVDAISQQQQILLEQFRKYIDEFEARLRTVEERLQRVGALDTQPTVPQDATLPATTAPAPDTEEGLYQTALNAVRDRQYGEAISQFQQFLQRAATHRFADRAQYWIAECHFATGNYQQAVAEYDTLIVKYPASDKRGVAMLKRANALTELGLLDEARRALEKVVAERPDTKEARRATSQLQAMDQNFSTTAERLTR